LHLHPGTRPKTIFVDNLTFCHSEFVINQFFYWI